MKKTSSEHSAVQLVATAEADDDLGHQLRQFRLSRGLSLKEVSELANISLGQLSQIERGISSPSIKALKEICQTLDISLHDLFAKQQQPPAESKEPVIRINERRTLDLSERGMLKHFLTKDSSTTLQMMEVVIQPDSGSGSSPYSHEGEECGVVIQGRVELYVDGECYYLGEGDSFHFESSLPHRFYNVGYSVAKIIWVTTPPVW